MRLEEACTTGHTQDREGFFKVVRVLEELETKEKLSPKTTAPYLGMLVAKVLHVDKAAAEAWTTIQEQLVKAEKAVMTALNQEISRAITAPPDPPLTLRARMLRVPLEDKITERDQLRRLIAYDEKVLSAMRNKAKAYRFHGQNVAWVHRKIMDGLVSALGNASKAAAYTARIMRAWNRDAAPESAAHIRTNYHERKRLARLKTARRSSK